MADIDDWIADQAVEYARRFTDALSPPADRSDYDIVVKLVGALGDVDDAAAARVLGHFGDIRSRDLRDEAARTALCNAALLFIGQSYSSH